MLAKGGQNTRVLTWKEANWFTIVRGCAVFRLLFCVLMCSKRSIWRPRSGRLLRFLRIQFGWQRSGEHRFPLVDLSTRVKSIGVINCVRRSVGVGSRGWKRLLQDVVTFEEERPEDLSEGCEILFRWSIWGWFPFFPPFPFSLHWQSQWLNPNGIVF